MYINRLHYEAQLRRLTDQLLAKDEMLRQVVLQSLQDTPHPSARSAAAAEEEDRQQRRRLAMLQELEGQLDRARREAAALSREGAVLAGRLSAAEGQGQAQAEELRRLRVEREDLLSRWERTAEQAAAAANARAAAAAAAGPYYHGYSQGGSPQQQQQLGYGDRQDGGAYYQQLRPLLSMQEVHDRLN